MILSSNSPSPEWGNENALRAYPLEDDAPAAAVLPTWLIADLRVTVDTTVSSVFVSNAYVSDTLVSVGIGGLVSGNVVGLLAKTVTRDELKAFRPYSMDRLSPLASGCLSFGEPPPGCPTVKLSPAPADARIVAGAVTHVRAPGVLRIVDPRHGTEATGIIDLSGNPEFRTSVDPDDPHTVVITLSDAYKTATTSACSSVPSLNTCGRTPVETLNGVGPDASGKITLKFR